MLRTVKNIADELGVEKFRIYKFIKDNDLRVTHLGSSKVMYFDDRETAKIIRAFTPETFEPEDESDTDDAASFRTVSDGNQEDESDSEMILPVFDDGDEISGPEDSDVFEDADDPDDDDEIFENLNIGLEYEALRAERMFIPGYDEFAAIINGDESLEDMLTFILDDEEPDGYYDEELPADSLNQISEQDIYQEDIPYSADSDEPVFSSMDIEAAEEDMSSDAAGSDEPVEGRLMDVIDSQSVLIRQLQDELKLRDSYIEVMNSQLSNMTGALKNANDCIKRLSEGTRNLTESLKASQALYLSAVQSLSAEQEENRRLIGMISEAEKASGAAEADRAAAKAPDSAEAHEAEQTDVKSGTEQKTEPDRVIRTSPEKTGCSTEGKKQPAEEYVKPAAKERNTRPPERMSYGRNQGRDSMGSRIKRFFTGRW